MNIRNCKLNFKIIMRNHLKVIMHIPVVRVSVVLNLEMSYCRCVL